jgi:hypothetical protein
MLLEFMLYWVDVTKLVLAPTSLSLVGYFDASYLPSFETKGRSRIGYTLGFPGAMFLFSSTQTTVIPQSSFEAEIVAGNECARSVEWVCNLLESVGIRPADTPSVSFSGADEVTWTAVLGNDNQSAHIVANRGFASYRNGRHIGVKWFFLSRLIKKGRIALKYVPSADLCADLLTKFLDRRTFFKHLPTLLGFDIEAEEHIKR